MASSGWNQFLLQVTDFLFFFPKLLVLEGKREALDGTVFAERLELMLQ